MNDERTYSRDGNEHRHRDLSNGHECSSNGPAVRPVQRRSILEGWAPSVHREPRRPTDTLPDGERCCDECYGDPAQYLADVGLGCPLCHGLGSNPDPEFIDASEEFDPRREYGTLRVLRGRLA